MNQRPDLPMDPLIAQAFGWDTERIETTFRDTLLRIDNDQRGWMLGDIHLGEFVRLVWITRRFFRTLFAKEYADLLPGQDNEIVCRSWNGYEGFGLGRRPGPGEPWREAVQSHVCVDQATEEKICPAAAARDVRSWICRPKIHGLVMYRAEQNAPFQPAFVEFWGQSVKPANAAYTAAFKRMQQSVRDVGGRRQVTQPPWTWGFGATVVAGSRGSLQVKFHPPQPLSQPDFAQVSEWASQHGANAWREDSDAARQAMFDVALTEEEREAKAAQGGHREAMEPAAPPRQPPASPAGPAPRQQAAASPGQPRGAAGGWGSPPGGRGGPREDVAPEPDGEYRRPPASRQAPPAFDEDDVPF